MKKWVTKDGRELALKDISEPHLYNIIAMLERASLPPPPSFQGEMAQMYAEQEWTEAVARASRYLDTLREELRRRNE